MAHKQLKQWHSPFLALIWKEWRESWWLLILTATAPFTWHVFMPPHPQDWIFVTPVFMFLSLCLGARLFAGEFARGTAHFQDERPVAGGVVWSAAVTLPIGAMGLGVIAKSVVGMCGVFDLAPPCWGLFLAQLFAEGLLAFAVGAALSVVMDRPITAAATGAVVCVAGVVLLAAATLRGTVAKGGVAGVWALTASFYLAAILILLMSRRIYVRWRRH